MGGLNWKNRPPSLARNSPEPVSAFLGAEVYILPGGWGGVSWAWSGDNTNQCPSGFRAVHGFWGVECWVRWTERSTSKLYPYSLLPTDWICGKSSGSGSDNEVDLVCRWLLQGLSSATTGSWARGTQQFPCPFLKINTTHFCPSPSHPEPQWRVFVGVLQFPSTWVEDHT